MTFNKKTLLATTVLSSGLTMLTGCATKLAYQNPDNLELLVAQEKTNVQESCPQLKNVKLVTQPLDQVPHYNIDPDGIFAISSAEQINTQQQMKDSFLSSALLYSESKDHSDNPADIIKDVATSLPATLIINSLGGSLGAFGPVIEAFKQRQLPTLTYGTHITASNGFNLLVNGDWRFVDYDTAIVTHPAKFYPEDNKALPNSGIPWLSTIFNIENLIKKLAISYIGNKGSKNLVENSRTGITLDCVKAIESDASDTLITPESALKLGFVDAVINEDDGTITYREKETVPLPEGLPLNPPFALNMPYLG